MESIRARDHCFWTWTSTFPGHGLLLSVTVGIQHLNFRNTQLSQFSFYN